MIITFYSYKGGVGRTMALANVAEILRRQGLDVLMVDFDLEAPGLERYFDHPEVETNPEAVQQNRGVVDLLDSYIELRRLRMLTRSQAGPTSWIEFPVDEPAPELEPPLPIEPLEAFLVPVYARGHGMGSVRLLSAGQRDNASFSSYAQRLRDLDWAELYERWEGERFFEALRLQLLDKADVVLIDSRTGVTEMSGVSTFHLADVVVLFVAPNHQNLEGTLRMAESLSREELVSEGRGGRALSLLFIPSRIDDSESKHLDNFAQQYREQLVPFMPKDLDLGATPDPGVGRGERWVDHRTPTPGRGGRHFRHLRIPYIPNYAYEESLAVRDEQDGDRESAAGLAESFGNLTTTVARLAPRNHPLRRSFFRPRVVVLYLADSEEDTNLALALDHGLRADYDLHPVQLSGRSEGIDEALVDRWFRNADFVVVLLSTVAAQNPVMATKVEAIRQLGETQGSPQLLPIRVQNPWPFEGTMGQALETVPWAQWTDATSTSTVVEAVLSVIDGKRETLPGNDASLHTLRAVLRSPTPGTVLDPRSSFYIERSIDRRAHRVLRRGGKTLALVGARQTGKSSLLERLLATAHQEGRRTVTLDLNQFSATTFDHKDRFWRQLCRWIGRELDLEDRVEDFWQPGFVAHQLSLDYIRDHVLPAIEGPWVLALDRVERLLGKPFQADFFKFLREWHNRRATHTGEGWERTDLILVSAVDPVLFTAPASGSPFNVATELYLDDFLPGEVQELDRRFGDLLGDTGTRDLTDLVGGHPYLVHQALFSLAEEAWNLDELLDTAALPHGPFGQHLRHLGVWLEADPPMAEAFSKLLSGRSIGETDFLKLQGLGLVRREHGRQTPRCQLYARYLSRLLGL